MKKQFAAPTLREEATLSRLTLGQTCSGNACDGTIGV